MSQSDQGADPAALINPAEGEADGVRESSSLTEADDGSDAESASDNESGAYEAYNDMQTAIATSRHRRLPTLVSIISAPLQRHTSTRQSSRAHTEEMPELGRQNASTLAGTHHPHHTGLRDGRNTAAPHPLLPSP
ncbi:hypothetical protein EV175_005140 [Coemansia sp. RSA 1933]|nr:hypothetical protein EV175_005140 [Coemansia sp. RSA 1933]